MTKEPTELDRLAPAPRYPPPESCTNPNSRFQALRNLSEDSLYWLDALFASFVVAPMMVGYWRGTWMLIDYHGEYFPYITTFIISTALVICTALLRPIFTEYFMASKYYRMLRIVYTYICAGLGIFQWRCYWIIVDNMFSVVYDNTGAMISVNIKPVLIVCGVSLILLFWMKGIINVIGSPFTVSVDDIEPFHFPTRFKIDIVSAN